MHRSFGYRDTEYADSSLLIGARERRRSLHVSDYVREPPLLCIDFFGDVLCRTFCITPCITPGIKLKDLSCDV